MRYTDYQQRQMDSEFDANAERRAEAKERLHATRTAPYWRELARNERAFAKAARATRSAPAESVRIHEQNAREYDAQADEIERFDQISRDDDQTFGN